MKNLRIYVDTSVIGGCFDEEFSYESNSLIEKAANREITLLVSNVLYEEIKLAPLNVQNKLITLSIESLEIINISDESERLRDLYIESGVVDYEHRNDAHHVALATVSHADMIVSWNFKHIVHFEKINGFNAVNLREGYGYIEIYSPKEVV